MIVNPEDLKLVQIEETENITIIVIQFKDDSQKIYEIKND